ncbi:glycosyltransferase family 2 protein [Geobacter sp. AOG1]|uniref:glycosyltransferase family 2 protein n=1 Tax=Geobacter sp. AOG1 TaxID=1566346 RepID=UPI001CC49743|nr:glycosyltransferase family 2 protein [Geobacter sp. AOG1]GFE58124.1 glycosyl transferase [Geobacter sp. AOG1]
MKLFTIAIPTFNRAKCLDLCLSQFSPQLHECETEVDLIISDNCSTDETQDIVSKYLKIHPNIRYIRNSCNIGPDENFIQCYKEADSKYVLIFGDDDVIHDHALKYLLDVIRSDDFGSVFLSVTAFSGEFNKKDHNTRPDKGYVVYNDNQEYIYRVYIDSTFISSNIINKSLMPSSINIGAYSGTNLVQLGWTLPAYIYNQKHAYIERPILAAKTFNSGGFRFFHVFVTNFMAILSTYKNNGLSLQLYNRIINKLLAQFYPGRILNIRLNKEVYDDSNENIFQIFHDKFSKNILFWLYIVPAIYLPPGIAKFTLKWGKSIHKRYTKVQGLLQRKLSF